ncbi:MAG: ABC transporter substrate-binding protein [Acidocella sp.]|nr:ABC transporter substrate-binding protein [Acidocella sp.]
MLYSRRKFMVAGAAVAVLPRLAAAEPKGSAPTAGADAVRVGAMFAASGPDSMLGDECWRGVQLAAAAINAAGGVKGKQLVLVPGNAYVDAQSEAAAGQFIAAQHLGFMLGTGGSNFSYPGSAAAELAQLPYIEVSAPADGITGRGFKFLLRTALTTSMVAQVAVAAIAARYPGKQIGVLFNNGAGAGAIAAAALAQWGQNKTAVRLSIGYPEDVADLHDPVARLQRAGVEVVLHAAGADDVLQMFQAAHDVGFKPAAVFGCGDGYGSRETAQAIGPAFEGTFVSAAPFYPERARYIADAYMAQFGMAPRSAESLTSYVGAKLVFDVLNQCDGDTSKLLDALRKSDVTPGTLANGWGVAFDKTGQNTRAFARLQQWRGQMLTSLP